MRVLKLFLLLLASALSGNGLAECPAVAKLTTVTGQVSIKPAGRVLKTHPGTLPRILCAGDEIHTFEGRALIHDGRTAVAIDQYSVVAFPAAGKSAVNRGQALFDVRKGKAESGVEVRTRLSVIGVKGTRFLVSDPGDSISVILDLGQVVITSTQGPVGLYREAAKPSSNQEDFASYTRQLAEGVAGERAAFEQYKALQEKEFVAYVDTLNLEAGRELVTVGNVAVERVISCESARALKSLSDWLDPR
jgi:hypothetical protein